LRTLIVLPILRQMTSAIAWRCTKNYFNVEMECFAKLWGGCWFILNHFSTITVNSTQSFPVAKYLQSSSQLVTEIAAVATAIVTMLWNVKYMVEAMTETSVWCLTPPPKGASRRFEVPPRPALEVRCNEHSRSPDHQQELGLLILIFSDNPTQLSRKTFNKFPNNARIAWFDCDAPLVTETVSTAV